MVLSLKRPLTRKVSNLLVVTMTEDGLILRRPGKRKRCMVPWEDLENVHLLDVKTYREAFEHPLPRRWLPKVGETILCRPGKCKAYRGRVLRVLSGCGEQLIVLRRPGVHDDVHVNLSDTRPMPW